jgi:hypothetical protein
MAECLYLELFESRVDCQIAEFVYRTFSLGQEVKINYLPNFF